MCTCILDWPLISPRGVYSGVALGLPRQPQPLTVYAPLLLVGRTLLHCQQELYLTEEALIVL